MKCRQSLVTKKKKNYFVWPNNGILSFFLFFSHLLVPRVSLNFNSRNTLYGQDRIESCYVQIPEWNGKSLVRVVREEIVVSNTKKKIEMPKNNVRECSKCYWKCSEGYNTVVRLNIVEDWQMILNYILELTRCRQVNFLELLM